MTDSYVLTEGGTAVVLSGQPRTNGRAGYASALKLQQVTWGRLLPNSGEPRLPELPASVLRTSQTRHMLPALGMHPCNCVGPVRVRVRLRYFPVSSSTSIVMYSRLIILDARIVPCASIYMCMSSALKMTARRR